MSAIFTGKNLLHFNRVTSTNNVLSEMLSNSKPLAEGSVIMAVEQTAGRGQMGSHWESEAGKNISLSLLYRPEFLAIDKQFYLSMAISLGICNFLEAELNSTVQVKWPNDIYVDGKKMAGILIENSLMANHLKTSIIGIGLNVNQTVFSKNASNAVSMKQITGIEYSINGLLEALFTSIENWYLMLKAGKTEHLKKEYLRKLMYYNAEAYYKIGGKEMKCKISNIEEGGRLVLLCDNELIKCDTKEIEFMFK